MLVDAHRKMLVLGVRFGVLVLWAGRLVMVVSGGVWPVVGSCRVWG